MARQKSTIDGFLRHPEGRKVGGVIGGQQLKTQKNISARPAMRRVAPKPAPSKVPQAPRPVRSGISRGEIDASLSSIDSTENETSKRGKSRKSHVSKFSRRKLIKRVLVVIGIILLAIGAYVGYKTIIASGNVFQGSILDVFQNVPLKQDENGRSNILILGTSEDDPGHQGADLTDSMMILSIDQNRKNAFMISIPRDLYVKYGAACSAGYEGRINGYYSCMKDGEGIESERKALADAGDLIGGVFGIDIQYGVNVNYTVMREMVNAVGGTITVNIEGNGATPAGVPAGSVMDSNFDWKCGVNKLSRAKQIERCPPRGHFIDLGPGPQVLDAEHALYLAQARGDSSPTWGLAQSNFDREKNQQKILKALREKAVSAGTLADFGKVSSIIDALGNNLRTTFETKEFRTLVSLAQEIQSDDIQSISLVDGDKPVMKTGNVSGQSVVIPVAGTYDYSDLRALLQQKFSSNPVVREAAPVAVLNGSGVAGLAQTEADKLEEAKYTIGDIGNAPEGNYARYVLYRIGSGNGGTASKLKERYGVEITKGDPPVAVDDSIKFVLIIGQQPATTSD